MVTTNKNAYKCNKSTSYVNTSKEIMSLVEELDVNDYLSKYALNKY